MIIDFGGNRQFMIQQLPLLYSFRRCPYAIRARMAIILSHQKVNLIEVDLKNKPAGLLQLSPKGTVPVLKVDDTMLLEESLDIMVWAFELNDPFSLPFDEKHPLIHQNDVYFKPLLDRYKYADRFPESEQVYQTQASEFVSELDSILYQHTFLQGNEASGLDVAIFPFIRQFSFVDKAWFDKQPWPKLQQWLNYWLQHNAFKAAFEWGR